MTRRLLLLLLLGMFAPLGLAADNPVPQNDQDAAAAEEPGGGQDAQDGEPDASAQAQAETDEEESDARFIPTEEISQDLGVSFPVDI